MSSSEEIDELSDEDTKPEPVVFDEFRLSGALNPPRSVNFTTNELRQQIKDGSIDLNPEYQRDVVWSLNKQVALIDSIFKNYYVPPIILAVKHAADGTEEKVCIDGKQRLTAINLFLQGRIHYHDPETKTKLFFTDDPVVIRPKNKKLLPERYKKIFSSRQIGCVEFSGLEDEQIREMFQRVQQGMTLNTAERMQAIPGPMSDFVKELDTKFFNAQRLGEKLNINERRNTNFHNIAQFLWMFDRWPDRIAAPTRKELHDFLTDSGEPSENLAKKSKAALKYFSKLVKDERYIERFRRKEIFAPVEFIFSTLLIALQKDSLSKEEISRGIGLMRWEVRLMFPGQIRTNKACCTLLYDFITDLTSIKMDAKEVELKDIQRRKQEEAERQREDKRKSKKAAQPKPEGQKMEDEDEDMEVDPLVAASPNKRKRVASSTSSSSRV